MTEPCRQRSGRGAVADHIEEKTFNVHKGLCTSWWLPWT